MPPLDPELASGFCGTDLLEDGPDRWSARCRREVPDMGGVAGLDDGICRRIRLAIDTDTEFLGLFGGDVDGAMGYLDALCRDDFIYARDVNTVVLPHWVRLDSDPWDAGGTGDQLPQFQELLESNENGSPAISPAPSVVAGWGAASPGCRASAAATRTA